MKKGFFALIVINLFLTAAVYAQVDIEIPKGTVSVIDDFENGNYWIWAGSDWDKYGGHKSSDGCGLSKKGITEGKYAMELISEPVTPGCGSTWFYDGGVDMTGAKYVVADFYNPNDITFVTCFVMQTTDNWEWKQTEMFNIGPGKHTVVYPVEHLNEHFNEVKRINICSYFYQTSDKQTSLYVDNIRMIK